MKMFRLNFLFAILMALVLMSGCKKDEDSNSGPEGYVKPDIADQEQVVNIPSAVQNSQDPNLQFANGMVASINGYSAYLKAMTDVPANAELVTTKSTTKTWKWTVGDINYWIEFTENVESYHWVLYIQEPHIFTEKTKIIDATQSVFGTNGVIKIYLGLDTALVTYTWTKDGNDVYAQILYDIQDAYFLFDIAVYEDGSGSYDIYEGSTTSSFHMMHCEWNTSAHGSWWIDDGDEVYSDTF